MRAAKASDAELLVLEGQGKQASPDPARRGIPRAQEDASFKSWKFSEWPLQLRAFRHSHP